MDHFTLIEKGLELHESFKYSKALPFFAKALKSHPKCPACIYNYANTLHMLDRDKEAKALLEELIETDDQSLIEGCPDSNEQPEGFRLDAFFLMYYVVLSISGSFAEALPYAEEHLKRRRRGLKSVWTKRQVLNELSQQSDEK